MKEPPDPAARQTARYSPGQSADYCSLACFGKSIPETLAINQGFAASPQAAHRTTDERATDRAAEEEADTARRTRHNSLKGILDIELDTEHLHSITCLDDADGHLPAQLSVIPNDGKVRPGRLGEDKWS
ncbi:hypothetical protein [Nocardia sp. NBC_01009]|uniref:hypothetical protein n=1 Tax=Nocardia sp. NBC_01009 TaxID=2975996 RepID=UPI00386683E9|nr:hypothetical protein OHA42_32685 [Nocardia sp. NBC_01009]